MCIRDSSNIDNKYTFKEGDYNGIGKWYMGREIAYVMGFQGIGWLERSEREQEENVSKLILNMRIKNDDIIADIGAGSGYHAFRIAPLAKNGLVYAVDIQTEMLMTIEKNKEFSEIKNIWSPSKFQHFTFLLSRTNIQLGQVGKFGQAGRTSVLLTRKASASISVHQRTYIPIASLDI